MSAYDPKRTCRSPSWNGSGAAFCRPIRDLGHVTGLPQAPRFMGILGKLYLPRMSLRLFYFASVALGEGC
jgi:hypothetical protein